MPVIVFSNNKGGVGKSALCCAFAGELSRRGRRVLVVDMDPQANTSRRLGVETEDPAHPIPTLAEAIKAATLGCAVDILTGCRWDDDSAARIWLAPSRFDLENRMTEVAERGARLRLAKVMHGVDDRFDWVLIDCPPSLGHLTQMAMVHAGQPRLRGRVLIVAEPEFDAMRGAVRVRDFVRTNAAALGVPDLSVAGVVINRVRATSVHTDNVRDIATAFGALVWTPLLPLWTAMADAQNDAVPLHSLPGDRARELTARVATLVTRMEKVR